MPKSPFVVWFKDVDKDDISSVGGKGANLGEMVKAGFPVPNGFVVTAGAYFYFLDKNNLKDKIKELIDRMDVHKSTSLQSASDQIRKLINLSPVPEDLARQIMLSYLKLGNNTPVAVRSSATAEDLPDASFAGQQETFLNVIGEANVVNRVRNAFASLFTPRAIFYRVEKKFDHFKVGIAVPVQKMIQSDTSGVMFTINPVNNDKSVVIVEAIWGLGELIVQGSVTPDHYEVLKRTHKIAVKQINRQAVKMVRNQKEAMVENLIQPVPAKLQKSQKISDKIIVEIAKLGMKLQEHYFFPQDSEWAVAKGKIYIIQTRPVTTIEAIKNQAGLEADGAATRGLVLIAKGSPASPGLMSGAARVIKSPKEISKVKQGEVLVTEMTTPDFVPAMKKVAAIVTDKGGQTSHAAIVSRELGITCVVGTGTGTKKIKNGEIITVNGKSGEVFKGALRQKERPKLQMTNDKLQIAVNNRMPIEKIKTATKIYVNLAEAELAEKIASENVDGVGLLRAEFMMAQIGVHPKKMIREGKSKEFIKTLAHEITRFAEAFYPRPVVYRATDFKTNEYRNLKGGDLYEPREENPLIGYRGAGRYVADPEVFELELKAIKEVRSKRNNLHLMIPFVRSVKELIEVKKLIYAGDLKRNATFQLWMMVELPVNVISFPDFIAAGIDGVSIGTNDLTMLILGTDRDNQEISRSYNEMDPAVLWALERVITLSAKANITCSVCGQAPSVYPELTENLVKWGITSISVTPDRIDATRRLVYEAENKLICQ